MSDMLDVGPVDEYESHPKFNFNKRTTIQLNTYTMRINSSNTEGALIAVRNDLQRSDLLSNQTAMSLLKRKINERAKELKLKAKGGGEHWWA